MLKKEITFFGQKAVVACDENCEKAWGTNQRPTIQLDEENEDDWVWLNDNELGTAPTDPGTYEGGHAKPTTKEERMNKWCVRECERCFMSAPGEYDKPIVLDDFSKRIYNMHWRNNEQ